MNTTLDTVVIGGGAMGSAAAWALETLPLRHLYAGTPFVTISNAARDSLVELGQYKEALPALTQGKSLAPKSVNAHLYLGIAQFESGDLTSAEASLRRAYELGGPARAAVANLHLASVLDRQRKPALAADALEAYLRDVPNAKNAAAIRQVIERLRRKAKG